MLQTSIDKALRKLVVRNEPSCRYCERRDTANRVQSFDFDCADCVAAMDTIERINRANEDPDSIPTSAEIRAWNGN